MVGFFQDLPSFKHNNLGFGAETKCEDESCLENVKQSITEAQKSV